MSRLVLERPLVSFDLETTGVDIVNDRIVQIALSKIWQTEKGYSHQDHTWLINPEMPIPKEASEVHGIYDVDVINVPTFATFATEIYSIIKGCDLLGFNSNRFDIPILGEALLKCGIVFPEATTKKIDAQVIFHERESRNLAAAYKKYCNKEIGEDAHNALHDAKTTTAILFGQLEMYEDLPGTIEGLHEASKRGDEVVDFAGKLVYDENGDVVYNLGKHKGSRVVDQPSFAHWMLEKDFPEHTKYCLREILGMPQPDFGYNENDQQNIAF